MPRRITASALPLMGRCTGQAVLEHYPSTSQQAEDGTRQHLELLPGLISGNLPDTPRGRALRGLRFRVPAGTRTEVAYAIDLERFSARELVPDYPRDYSGATDTEIPGTLDWRAPYETGELKTGAARIDHPKYNRQMWFGALAAWFTDGQIASMQLAHARAADKSGRSRLWAPRYTPRATELMSWRDDILRTVERVHDAREIHARGGRLPLVLGDHCGICDARLVCPAIAEAVSLDNPADRVLGNRARKSAITRSLDLAEALLITEPNPVTTDGRVLRQVTSYRRKIDTPAAVDVLPGLREFASTIVTTGDLDDYAKSRTDLGKTYKARKKAVEQLLVDAGALLFTDTTRFEET